MGRGTKYASRICALVQSFAQATRSLSLAQLIGYRVEAGHRHHTQIRTISVVERTCLCEYCATSSLGNLDEICDDLGKLFVSPQLNLSSAIDEDIGDDIGGWCFEGTEDVSEKAF